MAKAKETAVEPRPETAVTVRVEPEEFNPALHSWDAVTDGADQVLGFDLAKEELFDALVGVPFAIVKATFRPGIVRKVNGENRQFAYVSCEAMIAPEAQLRKRRVNLDTLPFDPESLIVFNDGSTGIYRQMVEYLHAIGAIELPEPVTANGPMGESSYDLPPWEWTETRLGEIQFHPEDGNATYSVNLRLVCPRGIRVSEYENEYNPDGSRTRYLG